MGQAFEQDNRKGELMTQFYGQITINGSLEEVWSVLERLAANYMVHHERRLSLLVLKNDDLGHVYGLEDNGFKTQLSYLIGDISNVVAAFDKGASPNQAFKNLTMADVQQHHPIQTTTGAMGDNELVSEASKFAPERHLLAIKKQVEDPGRESMSSIRLPKVGEPASPSLNAYDMKDKGSLSSNAETVGNRTPKGKTPWNPLLLLVLSLLMVGGGAGIIAGLNWRRLNLPGRTWPTILTSLGVIIGQVLILRMQNGAAICLFALSNLLIGLVL
jgi:hypothetical protein